MVNFGTSESPDIIFFGKGVRRGWGCTSIYGYTLGPFHKGKEPVFRPKLTMTVENMYLMTKCSSNIKSQVHYFIKI